MTRWLLLPVLLSTAACAGAGPVAPAATGPATAATVEVRVGRAAPVRAEVADTAEERAVGLTGRTAVAHGTGMVFRYPDAIIGRYHMFRVPVPLTAVFAREGRVIAVVDMPPCTQAVLEACPTYGPDIAFDTVLETAPETLRGLVRAGDPLQVRA